MRLALTTALAFGLFALGARADDWYVEARFDDPAAVVRVAPLFQHMDVDRRRGVLRVDTDEEGIRALQDAGMRVQIDEAATAQLRAFYRNAKGMDSIPGYACYRTVEETYSSMDQLAAARPDLASVEDIGPSWERSRNAAQGYALRALRVTRRDTLAGDPGRPPFVVFGSIHAREYTPAELLTRMAEWLVNGYGSDAQATWLVDHVDFRFVLQANPDGRKKAESGISWRKNTDTVNGACSGTPSGSSQPGIDLNRNFPFHWNITGGTGSSGTRCNLTYRGPSAASEPETQDLVRYVAGTQDGNGVWQGGVLPDRRPDDVNIPAPDDYAGVFFDIHSYSQLVLWPWGDTTNAAPNRDALQTFGRRLAWFNGYTPEQSDSLYPTDGTTDDTFYGLLGAPAFTIELGVAFFENCTTFASTTLPQNQAALLYAARSAWRPYRLPLGPDAVGLTLDATTVVAGQPAGLHATINDARYNQSNGVEPTYPIRAAYAYVDTPPWQAGAVAIPLSAADGSFNSSSEAVVGSIDTAALAPGRHLVYVQGISDRSAQGTAGPPDAIFLDVAAAPNDTIFRDSFDAP
ncbi:MAG: M14 family zinc carboxypeptidase [Lysobacterales bacterium]